MSAMLETHRRLYNDALAKRKPAWQQERRSVSYSEQSGQLKAARKTNPFLHKTARALVMRYGTIVHEALNIRGIARSRLAKSTLDVAWGSFLHILSYKAEEAGAAVIAVPPHNTTQVYSQCGAMPDVPKTLADRVHSCSYCGYVADRDLNAALNILRLGSSLQDKTCANGRSVS